MFKEGVDGQVVDGCFTFCFVGQSVATSETLELGSVLDREREGDGCSSGCNAGGGGRCHGQRRIFRR